VGQVGGFVRLVTGIRDIEQSLGDGIKRLHDSELAQKKKLRRVQSAPPPGAPARPSSLS